MSADTEWLNTHLQPILNDQTSGSTQILKNIIDSCLQFCHRFPNAESQRALITYLRASTQHILYFQGITSFMGQLDQLIPTSSTRLTEFLHICSHQLFRLPIACATTLEHIFEDLKTEKTSPVTVMTLSQSFTVAETLILLSKERTVFLLQAISTPGEEGMVQGRRLKSERIEVQIFKDERMEDFTSKCQFAFLGADRVSSSSFLNKVGSLRLALACKKSMKPLYVLTHSSKILKHHDRSSKDASALFEETPNDLVGMFITEKGILAPGQLTG